MPVSFPPPEALREFLGATTRHIRRIEIYEQDGITRWGKDTVTRLKSGSVSVDYDRDERRSLDLVLSNDDEVLVNAPGEMWYDKIIKVFRGVQVNQSEQQPRILVITDNAGSEAQAPAFRTALLSLGYGDIQVNPLATVYFLDLDPYDIIVSLGNENKSGLLYQAYQSGKSVLVFDRGTEYFFNELLGSTTWASATVGIDADDTLAPRNMNDPRTVGWTGFNPLTTLGTYKLPAATIPNLFGIAYGPGEQTHYAITSQENASGGRFVALHYAPTPYQHADESFREFLHAAMGWLNTVEALAFWEVQIGEFMVDRISEPHFPHEMKITGRDYTKKCMLSKFSEATQFLAGNALESLIGAIAIGAGVTKRLLPATGVVVGRAFFFERGTSRWEAMKEIATAYNHEIFFDATGYLVIRAFRDPSTSVPVLYIETGKEGQVASYEKSTSDASLFNFVLVSGESSDTAIVPVSAIRKNTDPNSPTSIEEIGERYWEFISAFVETQAQADELADSYLAIHQLEEFELSFTTLVLPWLEVGDILGWIDPNPAPGDPSTFLLSSLDISLGLEPMGGVGRRLTIVS